MRIVYGIIGLFFLYSPVFASNVMLEDMTWQEIREAIKAGKTTVIIPTGGTEQNGPHIVLGKHNFILHNTAPAIAEKLGDALVAPIMAYVPEGNINPPEGHMKFTGTLSLRQETFASVLEDTARSLKQHGFKTICFVGEHGGSQAVQAMVAQRLSAEWKGTGVKVIHISHYYDNGNGQIAWAKSQQQKEADIEAHGGLADTSEMLAAHPEGVRENLRGNYTPADFAKTGADGSSVNASADLGQKFLALKIEAAVKQIVAERQ